MTYYVNLRTSALRYDTHIIIIYHCDKMIAGIMQSTSSLCQRDALNVLQYVPKHMRPRFRVEVIPTDIRIYIVIIIMCSLMDGRSARLIFVFVKGYAAVANVTFVVIHAISSKRRQRAAMMGARAHFIGRDRKMLIRRRERLPLSIIIYNIYCTDSRRVFLAPRHQL